SARVPGTDSSLCYRSPGVTRRVALLRFREVVSGLSSRRVACATGPAIIQLTRHSHYTPRFPGELNFEPLPSGLGNQATEFYAVAISTMPFSSFFSGQYRNRTTPAIPPKISPYSALHATFLLIPEIIRMFRAVCAAAAGMTDRQRNVIQQKT